jgi:hypothetical protein
MRDLPTAADLRVPATAIDGGARPCQAGRIHGTTLIELRRVCDTAADALCAREADRRAGVLTPKLTAFHDRRVSHGLAAYRAAWESFYGREDDGRSIADVLQVYLMNIGRAALL